VGKTTAPPTASAAPPAARAVLAGTGKLANLRARARDPDPAISSASRARARSRYGVRSNASCVRKVVYRSISSMGGLLRKLERIGEVERAAGLEPDSVQPGSDRCHRNAERLSRLLIGEPGQGD